MEQFTFYELYADILQGTDDVSAGKLASNICAYEFEDREPDGEMTDKEHFYWSNIADILKEVKETERAGKKPKRYNLQSRHFTFYATYYNAMKLLNVRKRGIFVKAVWRICSETKNQSLRTGRYRDTLICAKGRWTCPKSERRAAAWVERGRRTQTHRP